MTRNIGFTLLEALAALIILMMLSAVMLPGLQTILSHRQDEALQAEFMRLLQHARSQSDIRHRTISLCHSRDLHACNGRWSDGLMMFVDDAEDGVVRDQGQILEVHQMKSVGGEIYFKFFPNFRDYIQFHPLVSANNDNGIIWYCRHASASPLWAIVINKSGNFRVVRQDQQGRIVDTKGKLLRCTPPLRSEVV